MICSGHVEAAIKSYKQALLLRPDFPEATCNLLHTLQVKRIVLMRFGPLKISNFRGPTEERKGVMLFHVTALSQCPNVTLMMLLGEFAN